MSTEIVIQDAAHDDCWQQFVEIIARMASKPREHTQPTDSDRSARRIDLRAQERRQN